jgi:hypothetical protein
MRLAYCELVYGMRVCRFTTVLADMGKNTFSIYDELLAVVCRSIHSKLIHHFTSHHPKRPRQIVVRSVYPSPQWTKAALFVFIYLVHSLELVNQVFRNRKPGR